MERNIIKDNSTVLDAFDALNSIHVKKHQTLFVIDKSEKLVGVLTDGDIRRGLLKGLSVNDPLLTFVNKSYKYLSEGEVPSEKPELFSSDQIILVPVIDKEKKLLSILDLTATSKFLPIDAVIMAGGKGKRLRPLTENLPKPLLKVGDTPILERNVNRLSDFGIKKLTISVNYLGDLIRDYFKDGSSKGIDISYVEEMKFLGTMGSVSLIDKFHNENILVMNSDLLTNIDFEDFYATFKNTNADMLIASIPYEVSVPYAVLENDGDKIISLKEKPIYTYYSNAGIYLIKKSALSLIPKEEKYDATDLIQQLIDDGKKVKSYPLRGYWLDIGKHADYEKAQSDVLHIKF